MNPLEDFHQAVRDSLAKKLAEQSSSAGDTVNTAKALSVKFYAGVPFESLHAYLKCAEEIENYELCILIQQEIKRRTAMIDQAAHC